MAALRLREVPRHRGQALHPHAVGGRGDGDRPHVQAGVRQGDALARDRRHAAAARGPRRAEGAPRGAVARPLRAAVRRRAARRRARTRSSASPTSTPGSWREMAALARGEDPEAGLLRSYKSVDTCAAEFEAATPYYYSGFERPGPDGGVHHEVRRGDRRSVVILGAGPNRIGQGIEFDYCCVHAAMTVRELGRDAVMINCNPETVSTDYDTSDRLYFEPLTLEDVLGVIEIEQPEGVIVQFGGQTPLKLARGLVDAGVPLLGTPVDSIDLAEDRPSFGGLCKELGLRHPPLRHRRHHRWRAEGGRAGGLPAAGAALLRARRPRDGDLLLRGPARRLPRAHRAQRRRDDLPGPLPRERDRDRRGRALRRREGRDRRRDAARRGGRRALGRLRLRDPGDVARPRDARPGGERHARSWRSPSA